MRIRLILSLCLALALLAGCGGAAPIKPELSAGATVVQPEMNRLHDELAAKITSSPGKTMSEPGLAGAMGGTHLKLLQAGDQKVLLPIPQLTGSQVPLCYYVKSTPPEVVKELRLCKRAKENDVLSIHLNGKAGQEVQIDWSAVILLLDGHAGSESSPDAYRPASASAQAEANQITGLAKTLWSPGGQVDEFAANIQKHVSQMKQTKQPRSLDAVGILDSGANGICTANANLALALLRAKGIAARSMAVIPTNSQRLEMHRIVEFAEKKEWQTFDPSSLHMDVPMKPYQSVIMAKSTPDDEKLSMRPRMGAMVGCPYGQELELLTTGVIFTGQDFFWTTARPLAAFEVDEKVVELATTAWKKYLDTGRLSEGQITAAAATDSAEVRERLTPN